MTRSRIALVGCGAMGDLVARGVYAPAAGGVPDAELVAVVDPVEARAAALAAATGATAYAALADAAAAGLDAVDIRTPHAGHEAVAVDAVGRGLHVLVEKPLAADLAGAGRIVSAAGTAGVTLAVAENYPHLAAVRTARQLLAGGAVGDLLAIRGTRAYRLDGVWVRDGWRRGTAPDAGVLLDQGTHQVSLIRQLGGEVGSVAALSGPVPAGAAAAAAGTLLMTLRLRSGVPVQSLLCWDSPAAPAQVEATLIGTAGRLHVRVDYAGDGGGVDLETAAGLRAVGPAEHYYRSHRAIVEDWLGALRTGRPPVVTGEAALADLRVVDAARRSLQAGGRTVDVTGGGQAGRQLTECPG
jgi:predicted dehydrogenase